MKWIKNKKGWYGALIVLALVFSILPFRGGEQQGIMSRSDANEPFSFQEALTEHLPFGRMDT